MFISQLKTSTSNVFNYGKETPENTRRNPLQTEHKNSMQALEPRAPAPQDMNANPLFNQIFWFLKQNTKQSGPTSL